MTISNLSARTRQDGAQGEAPMIVTLREQETVPARSRMFNDDRFSEIGYQEALESGANPDTYQLMLRHVLRSVEVETHDARDLTRREANELQQELLNLAEEERKLKGETLPALQREYRQVEARQDEVKRDPSQLAEGEQVHDATRMKVALYGVISLSCFLYIFYFIVGHTAFIRNIGKGIESADSGSVSVLFESVFDATAIARDLVDAPLNLLLCLFFPLVFMVVGYLFHEFRERGRHGLAWGCLGVIVGLDCTMAYKVSSKAHEARFLSGLTDETWRFSMIFSDVTFYMILLAGLAVYLIWGALLSLFFEEKRRSNRLGMFLESCTARMAALATEIRKVEEQLAAITRTVQEKRLRAAQLDEPGILAVFPWHRIEQVMASFTAGWSRGIAAHYKGERDRLAGEEKARSGELPQLLEGAKAVIRHAMDEQRTPAYDRR